MIENEYCVQISKIYSNLNIIKSNSIMMCQNCNCDFFEKCSIVGYMPIGFCCENCYLYDEYTTCLKSKSKVREEIEKSIKELREIKLIDTKIEGELLKIVIEHEGKKEKTLIIDLKKHLEAR